MINKQLLKFLEIIETKDLSFNPISQCDLKKQFKNNEYYNLRKFCILNNLININYNIVTLTYNGKQLFKILKNLTYF